MSETEDGGQMDQPAKHPKTHIYRRSKLFAGLRSFAELEARIAALPTEKERGDAFEVFVEAYLATQAISQAEEIWPADSVPASVRKKLKLPLRDFGADGIYRTRNGDLIAYQAKFRTGRAALSWRELATFIGLTGLADKRILLTNVDKISGVAEERPDFHCTRGTDFERLDTQDFKRLSDWLKTGVVKFAKWKPRPYQSKALRKIKSTLSDHDRATVVMACGTGKTLLALWAAERMEPRRVLVLVPSLLLLQQTLHEWAKRTSWGKRFRYLCVCSDPKVARGVDEIVIRQEEADFAVSTDASEVSRFLMQKGDAVQVVFSTYQSAHVVAEGMDGQPPFDIGIFDEAHKTAGREGTKYTFALKDENLPIKKRLFLTATPRHYDIRKRDKEGDARLVYSMDDEEVYGPPAYELSFAEAANQDIICNYKVVISIIDSDTVSDELLSRSDVIVDGDPVRARQVASQLAIEDTVEKFDVRRIITFHGNINAAKSFASESGEGVQSHLPDFSVFHVNGTQNSADRKDYLTAFAEAERGLITNARCLTEGVDVPAVDMVAFVAPKKSKVDIVQAVGRAMRKAGPKKTTGYVLVPLFLEQRSGETIEEALERSDFEEVANVLNAMQEHDEQLVDIIREMREERGRRGGYDESRLGKKIEFLGPEISLAALREAITAKVVDALGVSWDERFGELLAFKEARGHCDVPHLWKENLKLGAWCNWQKYLQRNGKLPKEPLERLEAVGFIWDPYEAFWEEMFQALVAYKDDFGDCNVLQSWKENPQLGTWCNRQRKLYREDELSRERIERLEALGFVWNLTDTAWEEMFHALVDYRERYGHCHIPDRWEENPKLARWCERQRANYKNEKNISKEQIERLNALSFVWNQRDANWEVRFGELGVYKERCGHCNVPQGWKENPQLGNWCISQRQFYRKGKLSGERIERLKALGFVWNLRG